VIYFVTICVANRQRVLANETAFSAFKAAISKLENWRILAAMLMPDHLHVIVAPIESRNAKLGNFFRRVKTLDASGTKCILEVAAWVFRSPSSFRRVIARQMAVRPRESRQSWIGHPLETLAVPNRPQLHGVGYSEVCQRPLASEALALQCLSSFSPTGVAEASILQISCASNFATRSGRNWQLAARDCAEIATARHRRNR
jgi:hypothetical protein